MNMPISDNEGLLLTTMRNLGMEPAAALAWIYKGVETRRKIEPALKEKVLEIIRNALLRVDPERFKPGDIITFLGDDFEVLANYGDHGVCKSLNGPAIFEPFYWEYKGDKAILKKRAKGALL